MIDKVPPNEKVKEVKGDLKKVSGAMKLLLARDHSCYKELQQQRQSLRLCAL